MEERASFENLGHPTTTPDEAFELETEDLTIFIRRAERDVLPII